MVRWGCQGCFVCFDFSSLGPQHLLKALCLYKDTPVSIIDTETFSRNKSYTGRRNSIYNTKGVIQVVLLEKVCSNTGCISVDANTGANTVLYYLEY